MRERTQLPASIAVQNDESLAVRRRGGRVGKAARRSTIDFDEAFPRHDPGPWPKGFTLSREEIYGDMGR